jgi:hypothetical protein
MARTAADLFLDGGFTSGEFTGLNREIWDIAEAPDGGLYIGGKFGSYRGTTRQNFAKVLGDGTDAGFDTANGFDNIVRAIVVQSDGKVIVGGDFTSYKGTACSKCVRLNTDATLDISFNFGDNVYDVALDSSGNVYVGGDVTTSGGVKKFASNGDLDTTFDTNRPTVASRVRFVNIPTSGTYQNYVFFGGDFGNFYVLTSSGGTEKNFTDYTGEIHDAFYWESDNRFILSGSFDKNGSINIVGLGPAGGVQINFGSGTNGTIRSMSLRSGRYLTVAGDFTQFKDNTSVDRVAQYDLQTGAIMSFNLDGANEKVNKVLQSVHKFGTTTSTTTTTTTVAAVSLFVGGDFNNYGGSANEDEGIIKLALDGTKTTIQKFNTFAINSVKGISVDKTDSTYIYIAGSGGWTWDGSSTRNVVRINKNTGVAANRFPSITGNENKNMTDVASLSDGSFVVGGNWQVSDQGDLAIRYQNNGSYENGFTGLVYTPGNGVRRIKQLSNGKIYIAGDGYFIAYNLGGGVWIDWTGPTAYQSGLDVYDFVEDGNGKILVVGNITNYKANSVDNKCFTINLDGTGFQNVIPGFNDIIHGCAYDSTDNNWVVCGQFTNPRQCVHKIKSDLTGYAAFETHTFVADDPSSVTAIAHSVQTFDDAGTPKIAVVGNFNKVNGVTRERIVVLNAFGQISDFSAVAGSDRFNATALRVITA